MIDIVTVVVVVLMVVVFVSFIIVVVLLRAPQNDGLDEPADGLGERGKITRCERHQTVVAAHCSQLIDGLFLLAASRRVKGTEVGAKPYVCTSRRRGAANGRRRIAG